MSDDQMPAPSAAPRDAQHAVPVWDGPPKVTRPWWRLWRRKIEWPPAPNPADYPDATSYIASIKPVGYLPGTIDDQMTPEQIARRDAVAGRRVTWYNSNYWTIYYNTPDHSWMGPWRRLADGRRVKA